MGKVKKDESKGSGKILNEQKDDCGCGCLPQSKKGKKKK